jgi:hypothetical protein
MAFPTTNASQELPAVNQILQSCGQAPVTTLDQTNPDVAIAYGTLLEVSREVQAEGWSFNRELNYVMVPNTDNEIPIPNNMLQIDLSSTPANMDKDVIRRNGKLYNKVASQRSSDPSAEQNGYKFTDNVECDIIWLFDWVDLPKPVQDYITARTAVIVSSRIVGDPNQYQMLQQKEAYARSNVMEYECNQGDYTFFGHSGKTNHYQSYKPFHALYR